MYVHLWATRSMNQEFKFKTAQNSKNLDLMVIQVLNSKLAITLRVSVTSAAISDVSVFLTRFF